MAQIKNSESITDFVLNTVPSQTIFDAMMADNQVNANELYLVEGVDDESKVAENYQNIFEKSGNPVTIDNGIKGERYNSFTINFFPTLSGTPSKSSPITIPTKSSLSITKKGYNLVDGTDKTSGYNITDEGIVSNSNYAVSNEFTPVSPEETYTVYYVQTNTSNVGFNIGFFNAQQEFMSRETLGLQKNGTYLKTFETPVGTAYIKYATVPSTTIIQITEGEDILPYNEYVSETVTCPLGGTYAGGTLDLLTGTFTNDWFMRIFDGTETPGIMWTAHPAIRFTGNPTTASASSTICSHFPYAGVTSANDNQGVYAYNGASSGDNRTYIQFRDYTIDDDHTDTAAALAAWQNFFATEYNNGTPVTVVYKRANPVVYENVIPPLDLVLDHGTSYISTDGDTVNFSYGEILNDIYGKLKTKLKKSIIAPVLDEMVADRNFVVNDFVMVEDSLYIVTSPIATDGDLIIGTNVTETTIGAQITALLNA